jgi:hypothetical protein
MDLHCFISHGPGAFVTLARAVSSGELILKVGRPTVLEAVTDKNRTILDYTVLAAARLKGDIEKTVCSFVSCNPDKPMATNDINSDHFFGFSSPQDNYIVFRHC